MNEPLLRLGGLVKEFGGIQALNGVDLTLRAGEVLGLVGDNGAGKSTLLRCICGHHEPTAGTIEVWGEAIHLKSPAGARTHGIEVVHQDLALCDNLTATENIFLGRELRRGVGPFQFLDKRAMKSRAGELFEELQSDTQTDEAVKNLSGGQRQAVAIARALLGRQDGSRASLILLDEPTAAISVRQVAQVLGLIRRLADSGIGVVLVSHRMGDVFAVCDRIVVLRRGEKVADRPITGTNPEEVTGLITGAILSAESGGIQIGSHQLPENHVSAPAGEGSS